MHRFRCFVALLALSQPGLNAAQPSGSATLGCTKEQLSRVESNYRRVVDTCTIQGGNIRCSSDLRWSCCVGGKCAATLAIPTTYSTGANNPLVNRPSPAAGIEPKK